MSCKLDCGKEGFTTDSNTCKYGCHHCEECGHPCNTYHEEDCSKAIMMPCDNGDTRAAWGSWADGRRLCRECFEGMGDDPRYTKEQNEEIREQRKEYYERKAYLKANPPPPLTPEEEAEAAKLLDQIFGDTK